jgi:hypothetical protein
MDNSGDRIGKADLCMLQQGNHRMGFFRHFFIEQIHSLEFLKDSLPLKLKR